MTMCPTYHYIDRADGHYARSMQFEKDYAAILSSAWDIDTAIAHYLNHGDVDSAELLKQLGIDVMAHDDRTNTLVRMINSSISKGSWKERYVDPFAQWAKAT